MMPSVHLPDVARQSASALSNKLGCFLVVRIEWRRRRLGRESNRDSRSSSRESSNSSADILRSETINPFSGEEGVEESQVRQLRTFPPFPPPSCGGVRSRRQMAR